MFTGAKVEDDFADILNLGMKGKTDLGNGRGRWI